MSSCPDALQKPSTRHVCERGPFSLPAANRITRGPLNSTQSGGWITFVMGLGLLVEADMTRRRQGRVLDVPNAPLVGQGDDEPNPRPAAACPKREQRQDEVQRVVWSFDDRGRLRQVRSLRSMICRPSSAVRAHHWGRGTSLRRVAAVDADGRWRAPTVHLESPGVTIPNTVQLAISPEPFGAPDF